MKQYKIILALNAALCCCIQLSFGQHRLDKKLVRRDSLVTSVPASTPLAAKTTRVADTSLVIRNSFESADEKASPATLSMTLPKDQAAAFLIDVGIEYKFDHLTNDHTHITGFSAAPFVVFNRNTMIDKQQNTLKGGGQFEWTIGRGDDDYNSLHYINTTVQYLKNQTASSESFVATAYYSYEYFSHLSGDKTLFMNSYHQVGASKFFYNLNFNVGLEFQDVYNAAGAATGSQGRLYGDATASLAFRQRGPRQKTNIRYLWPKLFELTCTYDTRYAVINTATAYDRYLPLFKPSLNYYPLYNDKFSIGLSYNNGADPIAGLAAQSFWQLAIQFQK